MKTNKRYGGSSEKVSIPSVMQLHANMHHEKTRMLELWQSNSVSFVKNNVMALSPDKGKGWVLVEKKFIDRRLKEFIGENFEKVTSKTQSDEQYLT